MQGAYNTSINEATWISSIQLPQRAHARKILFDGCIRQNTIEQIDFCITVNYYMANSAYMLAISETVFSSSHQHRYPVSILQAMHTCESNIDFVLQIHPAKMKTTGKRKQKEPFYPEDCRTTILASV